MEIYKKLQKIQSELKAPKGQYNSFGKFHYRNAEDILEAIKPLLDKYGCVLTCSDEVIFIEGRHYVRSQVTLIDTEDQSSMTVAAYAREEAEKKGMDGSQITGASSSYARKYALNGLFCIDDTKDSDTTNNEKKPKKESPAPHTVQPSVLTEEVIKKWATGYAEGKTMRDGASIRDAFIATYAPTKEQIQAFDNITKNLKNGN